MNRSRILLLLMIVVMKVFFGFSSKDHKSTINANSATAHVQVYANNDAMNLANPHVSADTLYLYQNE